MKEDPFFIRVDGYNLPDGVVFIREDAVVSVEFEDESVGYRVYFNDPSNGEVSQGFVSKAAFHLLTVNAV